MEADFPHARSLIAVRAWRGTKSDLGQPQTRYYISSLESQELTPTRAQQLIRGHWGGVESRNHWRRDACLGEDRTRSRNPRIVVNLAFLRNALLALLADHLSDHQSLPALCEAVAANPQLALDWIHA